MATNDDDQVRSGSSELKTQTESEITAVDRLEFLFDLALLSDPAANWGDQELEWTRVFQHFNSRLEGFLETRAHDSGEVNDVLSHTWEQAYLHVRLGKMESPRVMWTWLSTVALRKLIDFQRRRTRTISRVIGLDEHPDQEKLPSAELCVLERLIEVDDAFEKLGRIDRQTFAARWSKLPEKDRQFAYLYAVDDFTHAEVAELLGLPSEAASRQRWHRIKKHMGGA